MNPIGIFAKTFQRPALAEVLDAVVSHGLSIIQFNLSSAGLPTLPDKIPSETAKSIKTALQERNLTVAALSGTFNLVDPNRPIRDDNLNHLPGLAAFGVEIQAGLITVASGTPDPQSSPPEAWRDLLDALETALTLTEKYGAIFALEPEPLHVVRTAQDARRLIDELRSSRLKILLDGANLLPGNLFRDQNQFFSEAVDLVGSGIGLVHAKELPYQNEPAIPGRGRLDWPAYLHQIARSGYTGPLILHGHPEASTRESIDYLFTASL